MKFSNLMRSTFLIVNIYFFNGAECIRGGEEVKFSDFKDHFTFVVGLMIDRVIDGKDESEGCTGSILTGDLILTAAHCFGPAGRKKTSSVKFVLVRANTIRLYESDGSSYDRRAKQIFIPKPYFDDEDEPTKSDIAIVQLERSLSLKPFFGNALRTIQLPKPDINIDNYPRTTTVIGFGRTVENEASDGKLRTLGYQITEDGALKYSKFKDYIIEARPRDTSRPRGFCCGDSGGPLITDPSNPIIIGTVKSNKECDDVKHTGVYVRVTHWLGFIDRIMNNKEDIKVDDKDIETRQIIQDMCSSKCIREETFVCTIQNFVDDIFG